MYENADRSHTFLSEECIKCPVRQTSGGGGEKKKKIRNLQSAVVFPSFMTNSLTPLLLSGRHLVSPRPPPLLFPPRLDASLIPYLIPLTPHPACLGDTWLGLWSLILGWLFPADEGFA